jgi:plasmid stabilization system protein ParE
MSLRSVSLTAAAQQDIHQIAQYIARDSPRSAERFEEEFVVAIDRIREFPGMGHRRAGLPSSLLLMRVSSRFRRYLILYRVLDNATRGQIVRVLHAARDISSELAGR